MTTLASLITSYTRKPSATVKLNGSSWRGIISLRTSQAFGQGVSGGTVIGRAPPTTPTIGMTISWKWGYNGYETAGFTGEVSDVLDFSYPDRWQLEVKDVLWRAEKSSQVIQTSPLNDITAKAAIEYILTHYGGISSSRLSIPNLEASGSAWSGTHWKLGILTPVQWGDTDTESGGTTALKACQEICSVLGYWLYADASGIIRAKQMEKKPSPSAFRTFQRGTDLLVEGAPQRKATFDSIYNRVTVRGGNTGVEGAQIMDQFQTSHPLLPSGVYRDFEFSSFLIEYVNPSEAGAASATSVATRILNVMSRTPDVLTARIKADPRLAVGATIGIVDSGVRLSTAKNYFIYQLETTLDLTRGAFDQQLTLDGGTGSGGYTTIPGPDASFTWRLCAETLAGDAVVEVFLDGTGSTSLTGGEIVTWAWSTSTTTYASSPNSASGEHAVFVFLASAGTADITLSVTDTTSKIGTITQTIDLTGADTLPPIRRTLSVAFGAAWAITPDGGVTWNVETSNGAAIAVGTIGAGADDRAAADSAATYGLQATRGASGAGGLRQTLDNLATASTNLVSNAAAITSNIWVNEANPARVWFAIGTAVYRSLDGGATKTAMAAAPASVNWIMEDPAVNNSVFLLAGANMYNATDPTVGWALLYAGPVGATARQFVRSRDGQVTWICYTGATSGDAAQRVENGASADIAVTDIRTIALDKDATSLKATLYLVGADNPASLYSVDGLTGLSAATSAKSLPSGATAMHMLSDPEVDLAYIADFDSVVSGTGAVRKWLYPPADQLFLYKAGASGQQAHMLGLGAARAAQAEIIMLPYGASGAADFLWHYTPGVGWAGIAPPVASAYWARLSAAPFAPDTWLLFGNSTNNSDYAVNGSGIVHMADGTTHPLWYTTDAGATWTAIPLTASTTSTTRRMIGKPEWDRATGGAWAIQGFWTSILNVWRGTAGTAASAVTRTTPPDVLASFIAGQDADIVMAASPPVTTGSLYLDSGGSFHVPAGSSPGTGMFEGDMVPASRQTAFMDGGSHVWTTNDYRAAQPAIAVATSHKYIACTTTTVFVSGIGNGIDEVVDAFGSPSVSSSIAAGSSVITGLRSDRQTQTAVVGRVDGDTACVVYDGAAWAWIFGPSAAVAANLSEYAEVIVRST